MRWRIISSSTDNKNAIENVTWTEITFCVVVTILLFSSSYTMLAKYATMGPWKECFIEIYTQNYRSLLLFARAFVQTANVVISRRGPERKERRVCHSWFLRRECFGCKHFHLWHMPQTDVMITRSAIVIFVYRIWIYHRSFSCTIYTLSQVLYSM
mgnify:CR=1 FL=1